jgi:hypothetical protein
LQRRDDTDRLLTFLSDEAMEECGSPELKKFFATLYNRKTAQPLAIDTYRRNFNAFWNWIKKNNLVAENAMDAIPAIPQTKKKINQQVQPFSE